MDFKDLDMDVLKYRETFSAITVLKYVLSLAGNPSMGPVLGKILLICFPVVCACSAPEPFDSGAGHDGETAESILEFRNAENADELNIFTFNDDRLQRLDTYQHMKAGQSSTIKVSSTSGAKIFTLIANCRKEKEVWTSVSSREGLHKVYAALEDESREHLLMSGECRGRAGSDCSIDLQRLCAEVVLRSICCDFHDKPYRNSRLEDVKVYLTNVNAEAGLIDDRRYLPKRVINCGRLNTEDLEGMAEPDLLMQEIDMGIGPEKIFPDIRLLCYPNETEEENVGSPFTRLVIEGKLDGKTLFWPININRDRGGKGVSRNTRYVYDICISRLGHNDPDTAIEFTDTEIIMEAKEWREREDYGVRF